MTTNLLQLISASELEQLKEAYLISNTASFLYEKIIASQTVATLLQADTRKVIDEFEKTATTGVNSVDDLTILYALYVVLLNKQDALSQEYIEEKGKIHFEWFSDFYSINRSNPNLNIISWPKRQVFQSHIHQNWNIRNEADLPSESSSIATLNVSLNHA